MASVIILDKTKKEKFIEKISIGIEKIPYLLIKIGGERIRAYSGSFSKEELYRIFSLLPVEACGLYFAKEFDDDARLSLDALHAVKDEIIKNGKNIIEVSEKQEKDWFYGKAIELDEEQQKKYQDAEGFVAVKSGEDFIGTGKIFADKKSIANFLPKERRVKS